MPASITAQPAQPSTPSRSRQQHAEERRERRLEREHERRARAVVARDCTHVATRYPSAPAKMPGGDERVPHRSAVRHRQLAPRQRDHGEAGARDGHLQERERARVVAGGEPLHRDDLERLGDGVAEHERVADGRAAGHAVQQQQPGDGERHSHPGGSGDGRPEEREREQRRQHDVQPGDEARARHRRQLEPGGLQPVGGCEQHAGTGTGGEPAPREHAERAPGKRSEHDGRDGKPHREEREQRVDRDRVLHRDERVAPDRGHADEREEGRRARPEHPRRLLAGHGPGRPHRPTRAGYAGL